MLSRLHELDFALFRAIHQGLFGTPLGSLIDLTQRAKGNSGIVALFAGPTGRRHLPEATRARRVWLAGTLLAFALAGTISLGRVVVGAHFPSDVLSGAAFGTLVALLAVQGLDALEDRGVWPSV